MPTTSTNAGRGQLAHPDLGHDGGIGLWNKVHSLFTKLSDSMAIQWFGSYTVANGNTQDVVHNFDMNLVDLEVHILESDVVLTQEAQSLYGIAEKSGNEKNSLTITNNTGVSKTFDVYVMGFNHDKLLGREKAAISTSDATQTTLKTIATPTGKSMLLVAYISARIDATTSNVYELKYMIKNSAGTVTVTEMEKTLIEEDTALDVTITGSGANALVRVTGKAATTIEWKLLAQKTFF